MQQLVQQAQDLQTEKQFSSLHRHNPSKGLLHDSILLHLGLRRGNKPVVSAALVIDDLGELDDFLFRDGGWQRISIPHFSRMRLLPRCHLSSLSGEYYKTG